MSMSEVIRVAAVGAGYWGPNLIRNLSELPDAELRVICDEDEERLRKIGRRYPGAALVTDLGVVLADEGIDAVILATPAGLHHEHGLAALRAGKDVLLEKPLAMSSSPSARAASSWWGTRSSTTPRSRPSSGS
jgi:predicted dehydrogenase